MPEAVAGVNAGLVYFATKHLDKAVRSAILGGGQGKRHADKVMAIMGKLRYADPFSDLPVTHHGESRISNCVKYDLGGGWRLVTQQTDKACIFVYMGDHADVDRWLSNNKGFQAAVDGRRIIEIPGFAEDGTAVPPGHAGLPLIERLEESLQDLLLQDISGSVQRALNKLDGMSGRGEIEAVLAQVPDLERADLLRSVLLLLSAGDVDGASNRIRVEYGLIKPFGSATSEEVIEIEDGEGGIRRIPLGSADYEAWRRMMETEGAWQDWHLYLHPGQERVYAEDFAGPAQLSGVSGSGKTCVVVRRAIRLAGDAGSNVLLLTLNRSLAGLLSKLVVAACPDDGVRARIQVTSYFDLARDLLARFEPEKARHYDDVTFKLNEHVDEVYREFYRCWASNDEAAVLRRQHGTMLARGVNGEAYIREEFDWMRSALMPDDRAGYVDIAREGRRFPIGPDRRQDLLDGLAAWERKMAAVGVVDYLGLTMALAPHVDKVVPAYTHVLLDEAQDFGTTEMRLVRRLVAPGPNDVFMCGDVAQTILPKHRSLASAGFGEIERRQIRQNYRNSREILAAAHEVLTRNLHDEMLRPDDLEILDPRYANFSGPPPLVLAAPDLETEIAYARAYAAEALTGPEGYRTACIALAGYSHRDVSAFAGTLGVSVLDGRYDPRADALVMSDLEQTKGYEFDVLLIVNCRDGVLPASDAPVEESYRDTSRLYVAMTRARHQLVLSYHGAASPWLRDIDATMLALNWPDACALPGGILAGVPERLSQTETAGVDDSGDLDLDGQRFLYTDRAKGLSTEAQQKLVELVDGKGSKIAGGARVKWKTVRALRDDMAESRRPDGRFGSVVGPEVRRAIFQATPGQVVEQVDEAVAP